MFFKLKTWIFEFHFRILYFQEKSEKIGSTIEGACESRRIYSLAGLVGSYYVKYDGTEQRTEKLRSSISRNIKKWKMTLRSFPLDKYLPIELIDNLMFNAEQICWQSTLEINNDNLAKKINAKQNLRPSVYQSPLALQVDIPH